MTREHQESSLEFERFMFFTDAVIAIALTVLVLDLRVPELEHSIAARELPARLGELTGKIRAFALSFVVIAIYWDAHHRLFSIIRRFDRSIIWLNFGFLFFIVLLPFPTALIGAYPDLPLANTLYACAIASVGLMKSAIWLYASGRDGWLARDLGAKFTWTVTLWSLSAPILFVLSIPVVLFINTAVAHVFWSLIALVPIAEHLQARRRRAQEIRAMVDRPASREEADS